MLIDYNAPILPGFSSGGLRIGTSIQSIKQELDEFVNEGDGIYSVPVPFYVRYEKPSEFHIDVYALNGKVIEISVKKPYQGTLPNGFKIGMTLEEAQAREPTFTYDEWDEGYKIEGMPGVVFESLESEGKELLIDLISVYPVDTQEFTK